MNTQSGYFNALHWVGLDGWTGVGANNVLQIGTGTDVSVNNGQITINTYAWFEWWYSVTSNGFVRIDSFPCSPGDTVTGIVCAAQGATSGEVYLTNATRGEYFSQAVNTPASGFTFSGTSAEWIVEREGFTDEGLATLANYGETFFTDCSSVRRPFLGGTTQDLSAATPIIMKDGSTTLSTGAIDTPSLLQCYYGNRAP